MAAYDLSQDEEVVYYEFLTTKAPDVPDQFQITNIQPTTTGGDLYRDTPECGRMVLRLDYDEIYL